MNQYFYSDQISDNFIILPEEEAHHAINVLRKKIGDIIIVVDGKGNLYNTRLDSIIIKNCKLKIIDRTVGYNKSEHYTHIAIAPTKSHDRLEWFIEKVVEIGVQEITFINSHYSERNNIKFNRINKRAISSMKQSLNAFLPKINDIISFEEFIIKCTNIEKYIGYFDNDNTDILSNIVSKKSNYCILIGPEGGFTYEELERANNCNFTKALLGKNRLRTETAGIVACNILNSINS